MLLVKGSSLLSALNKRKIICSKIKDKISPYKSTAIDYNKRILFKKIHQEFLERYRIAVNNIAISNAILCQDIINQRIIKTDRDNLG